MGIAAAIWTLAATTAATTIYTGEKQASAQKKSLRRQREAQQTAETRQASQQKQSMMAEAKANQKKPNIASLLSKERLRSAQGPGSTMLTGAGGAGPMTLGRKGSLMGGS